MAKEEQSNALAQFAPVGAPIVGVLLAIVFIVAIMVTNGVPEKEDALKGTISTVGARMSSQEVEPPGWGEIPPADSVSAALSPAPENDWKPTPATKLLRLPIMWQVELEARGKDVFEEYDLNGDGFLSREEFARITPPFTDELRANFDNWDRYGPDGQLPRDGLISRKEFENPPTNPEEKFAALDKNGDRVLTSKDGEISAEDEYAWDTYPYEGEISFKEYRDRFEERAERDIGAVSDVKVAVDSSTMEIVVTWSEPNLEYMPEDITYYIERFAPETYEQRMSAYRQATAEWLPLKREWDEDFRQWQDETDADGVKNRDKFPRNQWKEEFGTPEPAQPVQPSEWEQVTGPGSLVNGTEYRDRSFETEVTYTYAVRMVTQKYPRRGQKATSMPGFPEEEYFFHTDRQVQDGHPAYVRNRVEMSWKSQSSESATVMLTRWHRIDNDWFKVRITQSLNANDAVGGEYSKSQLNDLGGLLIDVNGVQSDLTPLPDDARVNLTTGFSYVTNTNRGFLFASREVGDFELPRATAQNASESDDSMGKDNPIEVRALTVKDGGKEGMFEVTRWHKVEDKWLRVVWQSSVRQGGNVGGSVDLNAPGSNVKVWDASGREVTEKFSGQTVDMAAGVFDELDGRTVVVGGERFDLFGALYKE